MKELVSLSDLQSWQGEWSEKTFPSGTDHSLLEHLRREVTELERSGDPLEAADCLLLLLSYAQRHRFDLLSAALSKFAINQERKWGAPDEHGVIEHVREEVR